MKRDEGGVAISWRATLPALDGTLTTQPPRSAIDGRKFANGTALMTELLIFKSGCEGIFDNVQLASSQANQRPR